MTSTTHPEYNDRTEAIEVAKAFADRVRGKTVLITGVNPKGIGFSTAEAFASQSAAHVIVAGRTPQKLHDSIDLLKKNYPDVDYRPLKLDLSNQRDVRAAAQELLSWTDIPVIDIIVNSAGIMLLPERTLNPDGIEMTFATNHIGHFLFTCLIMPKLIKAAKNNPKGTRIVNVSSLSPRFGSMRWSDINFDKINNSLPEAEQPIYDVHRRWGESDPENKSYLPLESYNQSKVANVLFGIGVNRRLFNNHGILSLAVHPGIIETELVRSAPVESIEAIEGFSKAQENFFRSQGAGAATSLVAALDPLLGMPEHKDGEENWGAYLIDCQISNSARPLAKSSEEAEKLWNLSENLVGEKFAWS